MHIGVGSTNQIKTEAIRLAIETLQRHFGNKENCSIEISVVPTETSVPEMPLQIDDIKQGALERALFVYNHFKKSGHPVDYAFGPEGGVFRESDHNSGFVGYLQSWIYAYDGKEGYFGSSPVLTLPHHVTETLFNNHIELSTIMDHITGKEDIRSNEGAFGIFTNHLITRTDSFKTAAITALIPFYNNAYFDYRK